METCVYLIVKIVVMLYTLYKVWRWLLGTRMFGLWKRLLTPTGRKDAMPAARITSVSVVGAARHVILTDPRKTEPKPVSTTDLEPTGWIGEENPMSVDDAEIPESSYIPSEDELDLAPPDDNELSSSGVSFEDLGNMVEVLKNDVRDEMRCLSAAKTAYDVQNTEIMEMLVREVCNADDIENLIRSYLDTDGFPCKMRNPRARFDISQYV